MRATLRTRIASLLAVASILALAGPPAVAGAAPDRRPAKPVTYAINGDVPYGQEQEARFGELFNAINDDPAVSLVAHLGDIKSGSTTCTDARFAAVAEHFADIKDPLVYTPGDNEWTDCHKATSAAKPGEFGGVFSASPAGFKYIAAPPALPGFTTDPTKCFGYSCGNPADNLALVRNGPRP